MSSVRVGVLWKGVLHEKACNYADTPIILTLRKARALGARGHI